ncbi:MAG: TrmH family RNA methyltransferase [Candidatus Dojkabacteria bacterium]|nr:MAG: TrmH family RNA methyltransferase [Candidatus Dojkabacteria bacterium]
MPGVINFLYRRALEAMSRNSESKTLHIVLDNIRSAFNVGSVFRTADAIGNCQIYLCGITSTIDNPKIYKTALGATESVPSKHYPDSMMAISELKEANIPIFSVEITDGSQHFQEVEYPEEVALVLGHERLGVNQLIIDQSDKLIHIPMNGMKESLNVAIAGSVIMYEAVRPSIKPLK